MSKESLAKETGDWYINYYKKKGSDRNDILTNKGVTFQYLASELALIRALSKLNIDRLKCKVLYVGCDSGGALPVFSVLGFDLKKFTCIDILEDKIQAGKQRFPAVNFRCCDAAKLPFENDMFDLVFDSTMFVQITDDTLASNILSEMLRVLKPKASLVLRDWVMPKPKDPHYSALTRARLNRILPENYKKLVFKSYNAALVPPVGRFFSKYLPSLYFVVHRCFVFLVAMKIYCAVK
jgi:SAM-dependent methyltransferase